MNGRGYCDWPVLCICPFVCLSVHLHTNLHIRSASYCHTRWGLSMAQSTSKMIKIWIPIKSLFYSLVPIFSQIYFLHTIVESIEDCAEI